MARPISFHIQAQPEVEGNTAGAKAALEGLATLKPNLMGIGGSRTYNRQAHGQSRNTDVEGKRMIHGLKAVGVAWLMINVALFVAMKREDAMELSRRTIDRFWRAGGVGGSLPPTGAAEA